MKHKKYKTVRVDIIDDDSFMAPGGYWAGSGIKGRALIAINLGFHALATSGTGGRASDFRDLVSDTLAHEFLHVAQDVTGKALSEEQVQTALVRAARHMKRHPNAIGMESSERTIGRLRDHLAHAKATIKQLKSETCRVRNTRTR